MNTQQLKQIIADAPDGATHFDEVEGYVRYFTCNGYGFLCSDYFAAVSPEDIIRVRSFNDIRTIIEQAERIAEQDAKIEKLNNDISVMIQKAASKHLPAYREQGQKMLAVEEKNEKLKARVAELEQEVEADNKTIGYHYELMSKSDKHIKKLEKALKDAVIPNCYDGTSTVSKQLGGEE